MRFFTRSSSSTSSPIITETVVSTEIVDILDKATFDLVLERRGISVVKFGDPTELGFEYHELAKTRIGARFYTMRTDTPPFEEIRQRFNIPTSHMTFWVFRAGQVLGSLDQIEELPKLIDKYIPYIGPEILLWLAIGSMALIALTILVGFIFMGYRLIRFGPEVTSPEATEVIRTRRMWGDI